MSKVIDIPEVIHEELCELNAEFDLLISEKRKIERKMDICKSRLWDLLGEHISEVNSHNCTLKRDTMTLTVDSKKGQGQGDDDKESMLKALMSYISKGEE